MAGLLGDVLPWIYSRGNVLQRQLNGLLSDPVGSVQQTAGLLSDYRTEDQRLNKLAFANPQAPFEVTSKNALAQLADRMLTGPLGVAPIGMTAVKSGMAPKLDDITGLPLNPDGTVTVYHHTSKANAEKILKERTLRSAGEPSVYFTTEKAPTTGYGDAVVPVNVNPKLLQLDDEFPGGRLDFSVDVKKPGGSFRF